MSTQTLPTPTQRERGLGYFLLGGLGVTLAAMLVGGVFFAIILWATRGPSAPDLLPADTQFYAALAPNVGGVVEVAQLQRALRDDFGITDPAPLLPAIEHLMGVPLGDGNVGTWLGSELIVAIRGIPPSNAATPNATAAALLSEGEIIFLLGSKNDPQASNFLANHAAAREARGEQMSQTQVGESLIYAQIDGPPSPITAFALIEHYVMFSNSAAALEALANGDHAAQGTLVTAPGFAAFQQNLIQQHTAAVYTDGSAAAAQARIVLRDILLALGK